MSQSFRCQSCAAPLEFEGTDSRFQRCEFCGSQNLVPQEVRQAFASHFDFGGDLIGQARRLKEIKNLILNGNKIQAIKLYRETFNCGLADAKDAVDNIEAGRPLVFTSFQTIDAGSFSSSSRDEEKFAEAERLVMGGNKIAGIKHLRDHFGLGLKEAKDIADRIGAGQSVSWQTIRQNRHQINIDSKAVGKAVRTAGISFLTLFIGVFILIFAITVGVIFLVTTTTQSTIQGSSPLAPNVTANPQFAGQVLKFGGEGIGAGQFDDNRALALDGEGRIFTANYSGGRVQAFDANGKFLTQWSAGEDVYINNFAADRSGKVFIPWRRGLKVFEGASGKELEAINVDGAESVAVALDATLWVLTQKGDVLHLSNDGKQILGTIKNIAQLSSTKKISPALIAVDGENNVYVSERDSYFVLKFNSKGEFLTRFGGKKDKFTKETPPGKFDSPPSYGLAVDNRGRVYVSEVSDVSVFDAEGGFLDKFKTEQAFGMAFTDKNELWIASRPYVMKYSVNR